MKVKETAAPMPSVQIEKVYAYPPERVWQALTEPTALAQWLLPTTFRPKIGHRFRFTRRDSNSNLQKVRCRVVELDAPFRLAYSWQAEGETLPSLVTWTLEPTEAGTCLRLEHTGLPTASANRAGFRGLTLRLDWFLQSEEASEQERVRGHSALPGAANTPNSTRLGRVVLETSAPPLRCDARSRHSRLAFPTSLARQEKSLCAR